MTLLFNILILIIFFIAGHDRNNQLLFVGIILLTWNNLESITKLVGIVTP